MRERAATHMAAALDGALFLSSIRPVTVSSSSLCPQRGSFYLHLLLTQPEVPSPLDRLLLG